MPSTICSFASGKQGSSASFFDPWTDVKLDHIRNHSGKEHTSEACKDITFIEMKSMDKHFTHHAVEAGNMRKTGKFFGSVTGVNLAPLPNIFRYAPPLMHIVMGLGNSTFSELKREIEELEGRDGEEDVTSQHGKN